MRKNLLILCLFACISSLFSATAYAASPATLVPHLTPYNPKNFFSLKRAGISGGIYCAIKTARQKTYASGYKYARLKKGYFYPTDVRALKRKSKKLRGTKRSSTLKTIKNELAKQAICAQGLALFFTPTPTPTNTPVPTFTPTSTPTPTIVPSGLSDKVSMLTKADINHLYRRAALGTPPDEAYQYVGRSAGEIVDFMMTYRDEPALLDEARTWLDDNTAAPHYPAENAYVNANGVIEYGMTLLRKTINPFHMKLALLVLADRLVVSTQGLDSGHIRGMAPYTELLMSGARSGDYKDLLMRLGEQPGMISYLSLDLNKKNSLNENYARELMEIFSLGTTDRNGVANYTNDDIRQIAKAFTGWATGTVNGAANQAIFYQSRFDSTPKTIFTGTPWQGSVVSGRDVVAHILSHHPNASVSLAKFFAEKYLRTDPPDQIVDHLASLIRADNFNFNRALRTLFTSEQFYLPENRYTVPKTLAERLVHTWRVMDRPEIQMPFNFQERSRRITDGNCTPLEAETVFGCIEDRSLPDGQEVIRSYNQFELMSVDNSRFSASGNWTYAKFFPSARPTADDIITHFADLFGIEITDLQRAGMIKYLNNTLKADGVTLVSSPLNLNDATAVRKRIGGLFIQFTQLPQVSDAS